MQINKISQTKEDKAKYNEFLAANSASPSILDWILEFGNDDIVSLKAVRNDYCSKETIDKVLNRVVSDDVKQDNVPVYAALHKNASPESLARILDLGLDGNLSMRIAENSRCPPDALARVLERGEDNVVSRAAASNSVCPVEAFIKVLERGQRNGVSINSYGRLLSWLRSLQEPSELSQKALEVLIKKFPEHVEKDMFLMSLRPPLQEQYKEIFYQKYQEDRKKEVQNDEYEPNEEISATEDKNSPNTEYSDEIKEIRRRILENKQSTTNWLTKLSQQMDLNLFPQEEKPKEKSSKEKQPNKKKPYYLVSIKRGEERRFKLKHIWAFSSNQARFMFFHKYESQLQPYLDMGYEVEARFDKELFNQETQKTTNMQEVNKKLLDKKIQNAWWNK